MKLHLGCGDKILKNFINIDVRNNVGVDLVADISKLEMFDNSSIEEIYACHVLEHFERHKYKNVLERWYELLKPGGILKLSVPDLKMVMYKYNNGTPLKQLHGFLYGGQTYPENYHYVGFDFDLLNSDLTEIGFTKVDTWDWRTTEHADVDDYSQAYLPHMDKSNGTLMSLNILAIK